MRWRLGATKLEGGLAVEELWLAGVLLSSLGWPDENTNEVGTDCADDWPLVDADVKNIGAALRLGEVGRLRGLCGGHTSNHVACGREKSTERSGMYNLP